MSAVQSFDFWGTFFPHSHDGFYYRPLIAISFLMDHFLWNLDPFIMHFENILLHLTSSILIFLIARLIISKTSLLPLLAALVFAIHPIATESVNWISGRTDLLAVMFMLISFYSILCFRQSKRLWWLAVSLLSLVMGILSKETAIGFIPALVFIISSRRDGTSNIQDKLHVQRHSLIVFLSVCFLSLASAFLLFNNYLPVIIALLYFSYLLWSRRDDLSVASFQKYLLLFSVSIISLWTLFWGVRKLAFSSQSPQIQKTLGLLFADPNHSLSLFFRGVGFYVKKFFCPYPLNFVIREVSPFYSLLGIILLCLVVVLIIRRKLPDALVLAGFCMIAPVLPLTFESIAWTSYAERYVYPATPFWILSLAVYASSSGLDCLSLQRRRWFYAGVSLLIIVMAVFTFKRNLIWQTNLALFEDSVEKTPDYKPVRGLYMTALFEKGMYDEALRQYKVAESLPVLQLKYNSSYDLFHAQLLLAKKQFAEAERELDNVDRKTGGKEPEVHQIFLLLAPQMILNSVEPAEKIRLEGKMLVAYDRWYELTKDPMILYRQGQFLISQNKKVEASRAFKLAALNFPEKHVYRAYSEKLAQGLAD